MTWKVAHLLSPVLLLRFSFPARPRRHAGPSRFYVDGWSSRVVNPHWSRSSLVLAGSLPLSASSSPPSTPLPSVKLKRLLRGQRPLLEGSECSPGFLSSGCVKGAKEKLLADGCLLTRPGQRRLSSTPCPGSLPPGPKSCRRNPCTVYDIDYNFLREEALDHQCLMLISVNHYSWFMLFPTTVDFAMQ